MQVSEALKKRQSTRAFLDKEVSREQITRILDAARWAPSGTNTQPWQVAVVTGNSREDLANAMEEQFRKGVEGKMDYHYYPLNWNEPFASRRKVCGLQLYSALGIARDDRQGRSDQWARNYRSFDAPVALYFFIDSAVETGSYMDYGMFIQSVMLMAVEEGLATCPQAALGEYPDLVRKHLGIADDKILLCGLSMGYADEMAPVNNYRTEREAVEKFTKYHG